MKKLSQRNIVRASVATGAACAAVAVGLVTYPASAATNGTDLRYEITEVSGSRGNATARFKLTNNGPQDLPAGQTLIIRIDVPFEVRAITPPNLPCIPSESTFQRSACEITYVERGLLDGRSRSFDIQVLGLWEDDNSFIKVDMPRAVNLVDENLINNQDQVDLP